jgi:hypothetical protein
MREDSAAPHTLPPATAKSCGDCGLCCKLMGVTALEKPAGKWCRHFSKSAGCATAGFVLHSEMGGARLVVECDPARPHDWRREPYQTTLRRWAAAEGQEVLVFAGSRGVRLGEPDTPVRRA